MSLPKHTTSPPLSSSPSRHSLRRPESNPPSRPQSIDRPPTVQPARPIAEEHHSYDHSTDVPTVIPQDSSHADASTTQRPPLQPFFTLIEDATTSEYYHPTVHYIFSDDDSDIVTEAALRSLEADQDSFPGNSKGKSRATREHQPSQPGEEETYEDDDELASPRKESQLPPPIPGVRNNYIILDMDPIHPVDSPGLNAPSTQDAEGSISSAAIPQPQSATDRQNLPPHQFRVTSAHSLTPAWQVLDTQLVPAPTFEKNASGEQSVNGGLMLKIHGTPGLPTTSSGKDRDKERGSQRLEDMMEQFSKRLGELRQVMEAGEPSRISGEPAETQEYPEESCVDHAPEDHPLERAESQDRAQGDMEHQVQGSYVDESPHAR